jgi:hypothetical protein
VVAWGANMHLCRGFAPQEAAVALLSGLVARVRLDG